MHAIQAGGHDSPESPKHAQQPHLLAGSSVVSSAGNSARRADENARRLEEEVARITAANKVTRLFFLVGLCLSVQGMCACLCDSLVSRPLCLQQCSTLSPSVSLWRSWVESNVHVEAPTFHFVFSTAKRTSTFGKERSCGLHTSQNTREGPPPCGKRSARQC